MKSICIKNLSLDPTPAICAYSPFSGSPETFVSIIITNYTNVKEVPQVSFNGVLSETISLSLEDDSLKIGVKVPHNADSGKISIVLSNSILVSEDDFIILPSAGPAISDFSPKYVLPGELVNVKGQNFSTTSSVKNKISINGKEVSEVFHYSKSELFFKVPEVAETGRISIEVNGKSTLSNVSIEINKEQNI